MMIEPMCLTINVTLTGCLNPYSNGMMIERAEHGVNVNLSGLNPYSNGMMIEHEEKSRYRSNSRS